VDFIDLHRYFVPIYKDQEASLDVGRVWGRRVAGWLDWPALLKKRRVVLLAEASSGKSDEFLHQQRSLAAEGKPAFFVSIEQLADDGLDAALDPAGAQALQAWKTSTEPGFFFLDSVDEARLNRKNFDAALRRLARELDDKLGRTHLFISCRVSDWRGHQDRDAVLQCLPVSAPLPMPTAEPFALDRALLAAIFEKKEKKADADASDDNATPLLVVQLVPLDTPQRRALTLAARISDIDEFMAAIDQHGLEALAERPGDLLDLIEYWRTHGQFGPLAAMTEHAVARKLAERDKYRPDNDTLSTDQTRHGAERMAAALTLAQTFTIRAPAQELDPTLAAGALDADHVLPRWKENERNALIRRPAFAPATYGRVRFHHRTTQEYLTASWFDRLLQTGVSKSEVWPIFLAERYGVKTVVPSMRAAAGWLSLKHPDFRDEVISREPLLLIQNGDPGSLPLSAKKRLLAVYAERHVVGEIAEDAMDHRAIWMFAQPELADAIRQAWNVNSRQDFRRDLLRMIREAKIAACADLARAALAEPTSDDYTRISALAALQACNDTAALASTAAALVANPAACTQRVASQFSRLLFPTHLSARQLVQVIENARPLRGHAIEGFPTDLEHLYQACPDVASRDELIAGLAELALRPPFVQDYQRISSRYEKIATSLEPIAGMAMEALPPGQLPSPGLVRILMAVERADRSESREEEVKLSSRVRAHAHVAQALFWADVEEVRALDRDRPISVWQVYFGGHTLWDLTERDLDWLHRDLANRTHADDRRIALSAIARILLAANRLDAELPVLLQAIAGQTELEQDLANYLAPPLKSARAIELERQSAERKAAAAQQTELEKETWRQFQRELADNPKRIGDRTGLKSGEGLSDLIHLTRWLKGHTGIADTNGAVLHWQQLTDGFGRAIAEAYRDAMQSLWRITPPERPQRGESSGITIKWANLLSVAGIGIEAAQSGGLPNISQDEAARAAGHACLSEEGYPIWLNPLLDRHCAAVLPIVQEELQREWRAPAQHYGPILQHLAHHQNTIHPALQPVLLQFIVDCAAPKTHRAEQRLRILQRIELDTAVRARITDAVTARLDVPGDDDGRMLVDLATLFFIDASAASERLVALLDATPEPQRKARAELALARLFGRDHSLAPGVLATIDTAILEKLARFAYARVSPDQDVRHEGGYTPDTRDEAESARSALLNALLERPGEHAYSAVRALADAGIAGVPATRYRELARGKAERDCENATPWTAKEVVNFEKRGMAPIRSSDDLLRVIMGVLDDIQRDLIHKDASSRSLIRAAGSEEQVQHWLYEQLSLRANGRYHIHREPGVAEKNEPDIVISAVGAPVELAIEIKHGGKDGWSVRKLEAALSEQLVADYLRSAARRCGILVITHHGNRTWRAPEDNVVVTFDTLIKRLRSMARAITSNSAGPVRAEVVGIDTTKAQ
jgi:hypothetical protein